jgi:hypothetical protein
MRRGTYTHGEQPALALVRDGYGISRVARRYGLRYMHLYSALHGQIRPSHEVRVALTDLLGLPVTELFTPGALETPHRVQWNSRAEESP